MGIIQITDQCLAECDAQYCSSHDEDSVLPVHDDDNDAMSQSRRRVSYVLPPPNDSRIPHLQFPPYGSSRVGCVGPQLIPLDNDTFQPPSPRKPSSYPRHRLGVSSLALDTSTILSGRTSPEGILYSGGRDGLVISYDLATPMRPRQVRLDDGLRMPGGRWEIMTGWGDLIIDEEAEDDELPVSDGDVLGDVVGGRKRSLSRSKVIPFEQRWETDVEAFRPGQVCLTIDDSRHLFTFGSSPANSDNARKCMVIG